MSRSPQLDDFAPPYEKDFFVLNLSDPYELLFHATAHKYYKGVRCNMETVGNFPQNVRDPRIWGTAFFLWESQTSPSADETLTDSCDQVI